MLQKLYGKGPCEAFMIIIDNILAWIVSSLQQKWKQLAIEIRILAQTECYEGPEQSLHFGYDSLCINSKGLWL